MILVILIFMAHEVWADKTNFYHGEPIEFKPPKQLHNDSYFGFSTTYDRTNKKLIISAPTENNNGVVYECDISTQNCVEIAYKMARHDPKKYDHDYWFGATVKAGSDFIVACAPRFTKTYTRVLPALELSKNVEQAATFGHCLRRKAGQKDFSTAIKTPVNIMSSIPVELVMESLGWSMDIANDDSIIVGGPGMYQKTGLAAVLRTRLSKITSLDRINKIRASFNFGYGVAAGYFFSEETMWYAVGSTYGTDGTGKVYIYYYSQDNIIIGGLLKKGADDNVIGSMYGAVLCTANLKKYKTNKPADLLVGAPTYATDHAFDAGAVYVYVNKIRRTAPLFIRKITGQKSGSYFGDAIVNVGDLNGDGHDEVAIAAPYEDGAGAVYLYSGGELASDKPDKTLTYLQRISHKGYRSFGLGLSALQDHDNNGCNEIAISSPYDDRVFVYSCMAAVKITKITTEFPKLQNRDIHKTLYNFTVCIHVQYPEKPLDIIADISTDVTLSHIHAKLSYPNNGTAFTFTNSLVNKKPNYCQKVDFDLPSDGNYDIQIDYDITTRLLNNPMDLKFSNARVVLSDTSMLSNKGSIRAADCAGKECNPILHLNISSDISKPFLIGSRETETFRIDVQNTGEIAYDPCIHFKLENAVLYRPPMDCAEINTLDGVYECTYRKPLRTAKNWTIDNITLNLKDLTSRHRNFTIYVTLFNQCKNNNKTQTDKYFVPLKSHYEGIDIKGTTNIGDVINMNKKDLRDGKFFEHIYTITNNGMTNFENLITEIQLKKESFIIYGENPVSSHEENNYKSNVRNDCRIKAKDNTVLIAECTKDYLPKTHFFKVKLSMRILPNSLDYDKLLIENVTQTSNIILKIDSYSTRDGITTIVQIKETAVALWIILLAVLFGVLLIVILIITLSMCGCLTRRKKEKLKELKEKVKRESIRRSMRVSYQGESGRRRTAEEYKDVDQDES